MLPDVPDNVPLLIWIDRWIKSSWLWMLSLAVVHAWCGLTLNLSVCGVMSNFAVKRN